MTLTLYWIQCFQVNILKHCSMFSLSQCFQFFHFFNDKGWCFGHQKSLKFIILFRFIRFAQIEQWFKHLKIETLKTLNIEIALSFNVHYFDIENIESKSMLKFLSTLTSHWVSMFIFPTLKTSNRNQCQCGCRPLVSWCWVVINEMKWIKRTAANCYFLLK